MSESHSHIVPVKGKLARFNFSPKGGIEGLIVEKGKGFVQIVVSPELSASLATTLQVGKSVQLTAQPEKHSEGEHEVLRLVDLEGLPKNSPLGDAHELTTVRGKVAAFNFAKHGETNGVVLDNGDFLHLKPDGMEAVALELGDEVEAVGMARRNVLGGYAIEVEAINGHKLKKKKPHH